MKKRFIVLFAVMAMLCCLPLVARAEIVEQGSCGENVTYTLDDQGTLIISGTGDMTMYGSYYTRSPFQNNDMIKTIVVENGITNIGNYVFYNCSNLANVSISDSVTSIGGSAFKNCSSLTSVIIPDSVTTIGASAFSGCSILADVTLGQNVTSINNVATVFENCDAIKTVTYNAKNYSFSHFYALFPKTIEEVTIGDSIESIPERLFSDYDKLKTINLSDSLKSIDIAAFIGCSSLTNVIIPDSVADIGAGAFENCSGLKEITIGSGVTSIGNYAFKGCDALTTVFYSDGTSKWQEIIIGIYNAPLISAKKIYGNVYETENGYIGYSDGVINSYMGTDTSLVLPDEPDGEKITAIGASAFSVNNSLTSITVSDCVTSIDASVFSDCKNLTDIYYNGTFKDFMEIVAGVNNSYGISVTLHCNDITAYNWGKCGTDIVYFLDNDGTLTISGTGVMNNYSYNSYTPWYSNRSNITNVVIETGLISIGNYAFYDCAALKGVAIPDSVASIESYAFSGCATLANVTIPDSVTSIGNSAFSGCTAIISVIIPDSVTNIGSSAFSACSGMTELTLPNSITKINDYSFGNCSSLKDVTIPDSVTEIGNSVFSGCTALEHIKIGNSVETIGMYAFSNSGLTEVTIPASVKVYCNHPFENCENLTKVTLCGNPYYNDIRIGSRDAEKTPFTSCPALTEVIFSDEVENIRDYVLQSCATVKKVSIGKNVKSIGSCAFQSTSISELTLPDGLETIGNYVVKSCKDLKTVTVGKNMSVTTTTAFSESSVEHIIVPEETENFSPRLFSGCSDLLNYDVDTNNQNYCDIDGILFDKDKTTLIRFPSGKSEASYTIPSSVTKLNTYSFENCKQVKNVIVPNGINRIPISAFTGCRSLKSVVIPISVQNIANNAFENCTSLSDIYYAGSSEQWRAINIGSGNTSMGNAIIHYNSTNIPDIVTPELDPTPTPYTPLECNVDYEVIDKNITFTVEVKDITRADELKSVQLYAAEFDENGRFIGLTTGTKSEVQDGKITITAAVPDTEDYKFFLWDSFLAPLMSVLDSDNITK